jgi:hypothetical protein
MGIVVCCDDVGIPQGLFHQMDGCATIKGKADWFTYTIRRI